MVFHHAGECLTLRKCMLKHLQVKSQDVCDLLSRGSTMQIYRRKDAGTFKRHNGKVSESRWTVYGLHVQFFCRFEHFQNKKLGKKSHAKDGDMRGYVLWVCDAPGPSHLPTATLEPRLCPAHSKCSVFTNCHQRKNSARTAGVTHSPSCPSGTAGLWARYEHPQSPGSTRRRVFSISRSPPWSTTRGREYTTFFANLVMTFSLHQKRVPYCNFVFISFKRKGQDCSDMTPNRIKQKNSIKQFWEQRKTLYLLPLPSPPHSLPRRPLHPHLCPQQPLSLDGAPSWGHSGSPCVEITGGKMKKSSDILGLCLN